jgi:hypothetical protein
MMMVGEQKKKVGDEVGAAVWGLLSLLLLLESRCVKLWGRPPHSPVEPKEREKRERARERGRGAQANERVSLICLRLSERGAFRF